MAGSAAASEVSDPPTEQEWDARLQPQPCIPEQEWYAQPLVPVLTPVSECAEYLTRAACPTKEGQSRKLLQLEKPLRWLDVSTVTAKLVELERPLTMRISGLVLPRPLWEEQRFRALQGELSACSALHAELHHARPPYYVFGDILGDRPDGPPMRLSTELVRRGMARVACPSPELPSLIALELDAGEAAAAKLELRSALRSAQFPGVPRGVPRWKEEWAAEDELLQFTATVTRVINGDMYEVRVEQVVSRPHPEMALSKAVPQAGDTVLVRLTSVLVPRDASSVSTDRASHERYGFELREVASEQLQGRPALCVVNSLWRSVQQLGEYVTTQLDASHYRGSILLSSPPEIPATDTGLFRANCSNALSVARVQNLLRVEEPRLARSEFCWSWATALALLCFADWRKSGTKNMHLRRVQPWCRLPPAEDFMLPRPVDAVNCLLARHYLSGFCDRVAGCDELSPYEWKDMPTDSGDSRKHVQCGLKWVCSKLGLLNSPPLRGKLQDLAVVRSSRMPLPIGEPEPQPAPVPVLRATVDVAWRPAPRLDPAEDEAEEQGEAEVRAGEVKEALDEMEQLRADTAEEAASLLKESAAAEVTEREVDRFQKEQDRTLFHLQLLLHLLHPAAVARLEKEAEEEKKKAEAAGASARDIEDAARKLMASRWRELNAEHKLPDCCTPAALEGRTAQLVREVERKGLVVRLCFLDVVDGKLSFFGAVDCDSNWDAQQGESADRSLFSAVSQLMAAGVEPAAADRHSDARRESGAKIRAEILSTIPEGQHATVAACTRRLHPCTEEMGTDFWAATPRMLQPSSKSKDLVDSMQIIAEEMGRIPRLSEVNFDLLPLHCGYHAESRPPHPRLLEGATVDDPLLMYDRPSRLTAHLTMLLWMMAPCGDNTEELQAWNCSWEQGDLSTSVFLRPLHNGSVYSVQRTAMNYDRDPELRERYDSRSLRHRWCWRQYRPLLRELAYHSLTCPMDTPKEPGVGARLNPPGNCKEPAECGYFRVDGSRVLASREELVHHDGGFHLFRCHPLGMGEMSKYGPQLPGESPLLRQERLYKATATGRLENMLLGSKGEGKKKQPQPGLLLRENRRATQLWLDMQLQSASGVPVRGAFVAFITQPASRVTFLHYAEIQDAIFRGLFPQPALLDHWLTQMNPQRFYGREMFRNLLAIWEKILRHVLSHPKLHGQHVNLRFRGAKFKPTLIIEAWAISEKELDKQTEYEDDRGRPRVQRFNLRHWLAEHHTEQAAQFTVYLGGEPDRHGESTYNYSMDPGKVCILDGLCVGETQNAPSSSPARAPADHSPPPEGDGPPRADPDQYSDVEDPDHVDLDPVRELS